jgi:hypothetical protein
MGPAHASRGWTALQDEPDPLRHRGSAPFARGEAVRREEPGYEYSGRARGVGPTMRR